MSNVSDLPKTRSKGEFFLKVTVDTAPLLLEMVTKAAVSGPQAHLLAELYAQVSTAARSLANAADDEA